PISALSALYETMLRQGRAEEAQAIAVHLLARGDAQRKELYAKWRAKLDHAGIGGTLMVGKKEQPRTTIRISDALTLGVAEYGVESAGVLLSVAFPPCGNVGTLDDKLRVELNLRYLPVSDLSVLKGIPLD